MTKSLLLSAATLSGSIYRSRFFMQKIVLQDKVEQIRSLGDCQPYDSIGAAIIHPGLAIAFQGTTSVNNIGHQPALLIFSLWCKDPIGRPRQQLARIL